MVGDWLSRFGTTNPADGVYCVDKKKSGLKYIHKGIKGIWGDFSKSISHHSIFRAKVLWEKSPEILEKWAYIKEKDEDINVEVKWAI